MVATSLPPSFTLADIRELYHLRWGIETSFRDLKYTLGLVNLHGRSDAFAEQEIYATLTAFNFASWVCQQMVIRQLKGGVYTYNVYAPYEGISVVSLRQCPSPGCF